MNNISFEDNHLQIESKLNDISLQWLYEASLELEAQVKRNTAVDTGQLKNSWSFVINEENLKSTIGSPLENAIWEEFGTGEYALNGNGRKTPWRYQDVKGRWHTTRGKKPRRAFYNAFSKSKSKIIKRYKTLCKEMNK